MDAFLSSITILPFEDADAKATGAIRAALQKQGQPIGAYDVLIAGCALARGMVVVTSNLGEFQRIGGLQVENWR
jgi:tRNA(fMet)-specific endonuclease VapC